MFKDNGKKIAYLGVMTALIFVFLLLETLVFGAFLPVSPCYLSLPLAISLCLSGKKRDMFVGGIIFGLCSFCLAVAFPKFAVFLNPLISLLPRIIMGVVAYYVSVLTGKFIKNNKISLAISGISGALTNTILVITMMFVFKFTGIEGALTLILSFNALIEIICSAILVPVFVLIINKLKTKEKI